MMVIKVAKSFDEFQCRTTYDWAALIAEFVMRLPGWHGAVLRLF